MKKISLVLGFFDGVHKGHRAVLKSAVGADKTILLTFKDSPALYFKQKAEYIFPREKNYDIIKSLGIDEIVEQDFSLLANVNAEDYLKHYLIEKYSPISISTGFNYTFGAERKGNPDYLSKFQNQYNYKYICTPACHIENTVVSSTSIRKFLREGKIEDANRFLCSNFSVMSKVTEGQKLGRELGFPTANMIYPKNIVKLPYGVYAVTVFDKPAVLNWGIKPTVGENSELMEVHIPNFSGNLYNQEIEVKFVKKIRDEKKFTTLDELKEQIKKDVDLCLKL